MPGAGGSGEWARLCTHRPHDCIDRSKVQARDEVNVEFRLLAHHAELAFPGVGHSPCSPGAAARGGAGHWGHTVLVREGHPGVGLALRASNAGTPRSCI